MHIKYATELSEEFSKCTRRISQRVCIINRCCIHNNVIITWYCQTHTWVTLLRPTLKLSRVIVTRSPGSPLNTYSQCVTEGYTPGLFGDVKLPTFCTVLLYRKWQRGRPMKKHGYHKMICAKLRWNDPKILEKWNFKYHQQRHWMTRFIFCTWNDVRLFTQSN